MSAELTVSAGRPVDIDRLLRPALAGVAAFLAIEPPLRVLWWWRDPASGPALHSDVIWLALGLCALLVVPLGADIRAMVASRRWLIGAGLVWALAAAGSAFLIENRSPGTALRWPFYLGFALCLLAALRRRPADAALLLTAAAVGFLMLAVGMTAFICLAPRPADFDWVTQLPGAFNVRNLGYEALAVAMIGSLYRPGSVPLAMLMRLGAVAGWAMLFWSGGRGSLLAALVTLTGVALLTETGARRRHLTEVALLAALGAGISLLHVPPNASFGFWRAIGFESVAAATGSGAGDVSAGRFALWSESLQAIAANPWFGIGEGQMRHRLVAALGTFPQPHNLLLQGPIAWGLAGGAAFLVAIAFPLGRAVRRHGRQGMPEAPATAGLAVAVAMAVQSMFDGTLFHPRPVTMFLIGCAVALAAPRHRDERASTS